MTPQRERILEVMDERSKGKTVTEKKAVPDDAAAVRPDASDCERHREDLLDEALEETFPASDPPSIARPAGKGC